ncbi:MAG: nitroreductase [Xanthomonadaceae bacterium]|nr:nitroreductase [Xanthomonadaceae bacterium]MDE1958319.1 nitroreductase [Xanthomonadaceae bacterium]MDE2178478.1 nitroreductase [Xanthomonadaceae bacterium]MDE2245257.1 nitroreductase [Xanthomonadaceae bacterium]
MSASPLFAALARRHSVPARLLTVPAPNGAEREALLAFALRVPDHGRLQPWRLITIEGAALAAFAGRLATRLAAREPAADAARLDKERARYAHGALVVAVVARIDAGHARIPAQEQLLSAGCVAYNLLLGAEALGYGAQWLTGWAAYDSAVAAVLGLHADEQLIGLVHVGSVRAEPAPVPRADPAACVSAWTP